MINHLESRKSRLLERQIADKRREKNRKANNRHQASSQPKESTKRPKLDSLDDIYNLWDTKETAKETT
jgi:hypothetical protein